MLRRPIGERGTWFADYDGERLPCVHDYWWERGRYTDKLLRATYKSEQFVQAIREKGRVILTRDKPNSIENPIPFTRTGYVSLWEVDEIEFDDAGLRFRFARNLGSFK